MEKRIYVIAEHGEGKIRPVTYEVMAFAEQLRRMRNLPIELLLIGENLSGMAGESENAGADYLTLLEIPGLHYYSGEIYRQALHNFFSERNPAFICTAHSAQGTDFSPGLAVRMKAANITGVQGLEQEQGKLCFLRSIDNGKRIARVRPQTETVILNIQPGIWRPGKDRPDAPAPLSRLRMECSAENILFAGLCPNRTDISGLSQAEVIVAVGNGIGNGEHMDMIHQMAAIFHKSAVAASRIVCDRGLLPCSQQVGITGATVAPRLYIACGISGSSQHLAGMSRSEFIVAVNTDARAPIMNAADVCIVEDMRRFIPFFMDAYNNRQ